MLYFFALFSQAYSSHPNIYYRAILHYITFYGQSIIGGLPVCAFYFAYNLSSTIELYKGS
jgi:hypothetical protein